TCSFDVTVNTFVGIADLSANGISIYPNPTNGIVNFEFVNNNIQKLTISDITGKKIREKTQIQQNESIDLSSFVSGIYIISIQTDKKIFTTKIIKE
ncbi:MAG TPA: T9SS type A sorting domain-containing protein, partial [Bacteroidales bacterium]|nr:T9SS type A sorting domain-containing protein [Bacteroidales bacterium]